ncbi:MAG TPA: thiamine phosphate synthase [Bryobacteraceae bacterium]|jgi:thiamine-phosphate pyrophosphorylase|nr:thiamine phosphate synthase [Bryobacteraceae bacterium]
MTIPRFYPILDVETAERRGIKPAAAAQQILNAGARILQLREKRFFSRDRMAEAERIAALCQRAGAIFVINDRADIARLLGAALHLGQDDLAPREARRIVGESAIVGFSTHNEAQLRAAIREPADYLALGPIFGTHTKQNPDPAVGIDELRRLRAFTAQPLVAIGGITRENARAVIEAGANSVAVISDLFPEGGRVGQRAGEWLALLG